MDLSEAHVKALDFLDENNGINIFIIGTGKGESVLELIKTFEDISGLQVLLNFLKGEEILIVTQPQKANTVLKWSAKYNLNQMCESAWKYINKT